MFNRKRLRDSNCSSGEYASSRDSDSSSNSSNSNSSNSNSSNSSNSSNNSCCKVNEDDVLFYFSHFEDDVIESVLKYINDVKDKYVHQIYETFNHLINQIDEDLQFAVNESESDKDRDMLSDSYPTAPFPALPEFPKADIETLKLVGYNAAWNHPYRDFLRFNFSKLERDPVPLHVNFDTPAVQGRRVCYLPTEELKESSFYSINGDFHKSLNSTIKTPEEYGDAAAVCAAAASFANRTSTSSTSSAGNEILLLNVEQNVEPRLLRFMAEHPLGRTCLPLRFRDEDEDEAEQNDDQAPGNAAGISRQSQYDNGRLFDKRDEEALQLPSFNSVYHNNRNRTVKFDSSTLQQEQEQQEHEQQQQEQQQHKQRELKQSQQEKNEPAKSQLDQSEKEQHRHRIGSLNTPGTVVIETPRRNAEREEQQQSSEANVVVGEAAASSNRSPGVKQLISWFSNYKGATPKQTPIRGDAVAAALQAAKRWQLPGSPVCNRSASVLVDPQSKQTAGQEQQPQNAVATAKPNIQSGQKLSLQIECVDATMGLAAEPAGAAKPEKGTKGRDKEAKSEKADNKGETSRIQGNSCPLANYEDEVYQPTIAFEKNLLTTELVTEKSRTPQNTEGTAGTDVEGFSCGTRGEQNRGGQESCVYNEIRHDHPNEQQQLDYPNRFIITPDFVTARDADFVDLEEKGFNQDNADTDDNKRNENNDYGSDVDDLFIATNDLHSNGGNSIESESKVFTVAAADAVDGNAGGNADDNANASAVANADDNPNAADAADAKTVDANAEADVDAAADDNDYNNDVGKDYSNGESDDCSTPVFDSCIAAAAATTNLYSCEVSHKEEEFKASEMINQSKSDKNVEANSDKESAAAAAAVSISNLHSSGDEVYYYKRKNSSNQDMMTKPKTTGDVLLELPESTGKEQPKQNTAEANLKRDDSRCNNEADEALGLSTSCFDRRRFASLDPNVTSEVLRQQAEFGLELRQRIPKTGFEILVHPGQQERQKAKEINWSRGEICEVRFRGDDVRRMEGSRLGEKDEKSSTAVAAKQINVMIEETLLEKTAEESATYVAAVADVETTTSEKVNTNTNNNSSNSCSSINDYSAGVETADDDDCVMVDFEDRSEQGSGLNSRRSSDLIKSHNQRLGNASSTSEIDGESSSNKNGKRSNSRPGTVVLPADTSPSTTLTLKGEHHHMKSCDDAEVSLPLSREGETEQLSVGKHQLQQQQQTRELSSIQLPSKFELASALLPVAATSLAQTFSLIPVLGKAEETAAKQTKQKQEPGLCQLLNAQNAANLTGGNNNCKPAVPSLLSSSVFSSNFSSSEPQQQQLLLLSSAATEKGRGSEATAADLDVPEAPEIVSRLTPRGPAPKKNRMHRFLKKIGEKNWDDQADLSEDEQQPRKRAGIKTASWAHNINDWHNQVRQQSFIDPISIFGCGVRPVEFRDVFQTPDFCRAFKELPNYQNRHQQNLDAQELLSRRGREEKIKKWLKDKQQCGFGEHEGVTIQEVLRFRKRAKRRIDVSYLVWDTWTLCSDECEHDSTRRQPWFQQIGASPAANNTSPNSSSSTGGRRRVWGSPLPSSRWLENVEEGDEDDEHLRLVNQKVECTPQSYTRGVFFNCLNKQPTKFSNALHEIKTEEKRNLDHSAVSFGLKHLDSSLVESKPHLSPINPFSRLIPVTSTIEDSSQHIHNHNNDHNYYHHNNKIPSCTYHSRENPKTLFRSVYTTAEEIGSNKASHTANKLSNYQQVQQH